jgi:hypothetical protein
MLRIIVILVKRNKGELMSSPSNIVSQREEIYKDKRKYKEQRYKKLIQDIENIDDWANYSTNNGLYYPSLKEPINGINNKLCY